MTLRLLGALLLGVACKAHAPEPDIESRYLDDRVFRRAELEASLVRPTNGYSRLRLARYASGNSQDWERLPIANPRTTPVTVRELDDAHGVDPRRAIEPSAHSLQFDPAQVRRSKEALRQLGERAFFRYPAQLAGSSAPALRSRSTAERYGFWIDDMRGVGGIVATETADGGSELAYTCATCHASRQGSTLAIGRANDRLDLGRLMADLGGSQDTRSWGPGRVDVSTTSGNEPVRIADLRPVRYLTHLHHEATVEKRNVVSLAIRIETLLIVGHHEARRPPREIALGLAVYLESLAPPLPAPPTADVERRGAALFATHCARCHAPPAFTGRPVAIEAVGTDPMLGLSSDRGTGMVRVPSLLGVASRGALLHDASVRGIEPLFAPSRLTGHTFGAGLDTEQRADLIAYVRSL